MELSVLLFLTSGLFLGWSLGANDAANVFGTAVGTRMVTFFTAAVVCSVFVVLGAVISGSGAAHTLGALGSVNALAGSFMAALAAGLTVYYMTKWGLPVSTSQAIVGAIIGWNLFSDSVTDTSTLLKIVSTWIACPLLAGLIAVVLLKIVTAFLHVMKFHLLRLDAYTRLALVFAGAFGSYSLGANNIANVMGVFVDVSPFTKIQFDGLFTLSSVEQLFLLGGLAIAVGVFTYSKRVMMTVGSALMPMSPVAAWVVVIAHSIVLFLFASEGLEHLLAQSGLPTIPLVPVSSSQAVVGAVIGLGLMRGGKDIDWKLVGNIGLGWLTTPVISALVCFVFLFFLQNVFNQRVYNEVHYVLSERVLEKLDEQGLVTEDLAELKGEDFPSARAFLDAFDQSTFVSSERVKKALTIAELRPVSIHPDWIDSLDREWLTPAQFDALNRLVGARFDHVWQLQEALSTMSDEWRFRPSTKANKLINKDLAQKLEYLVRHFAIAKTEQSRRRVRRLSY
ncbi:MAG: inorganic phosphate transporter [Gammaproteobacteria bacterium]|nr:inorganic phosphate transporter [Gammaproteobacteria bacterium]